MDNQIELFRVDDERDYIGKDGKTHHSYSWLLMSDNVYQYILPNMFGGKGRNVLMFMPYRNIKRSSLNEVLLKKTEVR